MHVRAKVRQNQISIRKIGPSFANLMDLRDARLAHEQGRITKTNRVMQRLIENDFDVQKTLDHYRGRV